MLDLDGVGKGLAAGDRAEVRPVFMFAGRGQGVRGEVPRGGLLCGAAFGTALTPALTPALSR